MAYVVGIVLSLGVALFARRVGFDRLAAQSFIQVPSDEVAANGVPAIHSVKSRFRMPHGFSL